MTYMSFKFTSFLALTPTLPVSRCLKRLLLFKIMILKKSFYFSIIKYICWSPNTKYNNILIRCKFR